MGLAWSAAKPVAAAAVLTTRHRTITAPPLTRFTSSRSQRKSGLAEYWPLAITGPAGTAAGALAGAAAGVAGVAARVCAVSGDGVACFWHPASKTKLRTAKTIVNLKPVLDQNMSPPR